MRSRGPRGVYRTRKFAARRAELRRLHARGLSQRAMAMALGVSFNTVTAWLDRLGLARRAAAAAGHAERAALARRLAEAGLKRSAIARRVGLSHAALDRLLKRCGVRTGPARYIPREAYAS